MAAAKTSAVSSADKLIGEIRVMYNVSRKNRLKMNCELIDEKIARRETARKEKIGWCAPARSTENSSTARQATSSGIETDIARERRSDKKIFVSKGDDKACVHALKSEGRKSCCCSMERNGAFFGHYPTTVKQYRSCGLRKVFSAVRGNAISRIIGEVAFQLEKRIILHVFPDADQVYYGTLLDIRRVIASEPDQDLRARYARALHCRIQRLESLGWDINYHVDFGNKMMAKHGVGAPAFFYEERDPLAVHAQLARLIARKLPLAERIDMTTVLSGLLSLALEDKRALFLTTTGEEFEFMK